MTMHLLRNAALLAICLTAIGPGAYAQSSVGINFVGGSAAGGAPRLRQPGEVAGADPQDHWNNAGAFGSPLTVDNEAGTVTATSKATISPATRPRCYAG